MQLNMLPSPLYQVEGGGGAAAPAPGGDASVSAPNAPVGAPAAPAPAAQPHEQPAQYTYKEDRSNWVPSHVVRQATERQRQSEQALFIERQRVAALSGVAPLPAPSDPEQDAVRQQFAKLYPGLAKLEAMSDKLEKLTGVDLDGIQSSQQQVWVAHGTQVLQALTDRVKAAYGGTALAPKALQRISRAFVTEVADDPDMRARYEAGDMTIVDEFVKDYTAGVLDPYRRSTTVAQAPTHEAARRLPRGGGSSAIVGARPAALKPSDPGFHAAAFQRFQQGE